MSSYDNYANAIISFLNAPEYPESTAELYRKILMDLKEYLLFVGEEYSPDSASEWLRIQIDTNAIDDEQITSYCRCVNTLSFISQHGFVNARNLKCEKLILLDCYRTIRDEYLESIRPAMATRTMATIKWALDMFLRFMQVNHLSIEQFDYDCIDTYFECYPDHSSIHFVLEDFADYLAKTRLLYLHLKDYIHYFKLMKPLESYSEECRSTFAVDPDNYCHRKVSSVCENIISDLERSQYKYAVIKTSHRTFTLFVTFMERYHLTFSENMARSWLKENKETLKGAWDMAKTAIDKLICCWYGRPSKPARGELYHCPAWASEDLQRFLELKKAEKWSESAVENYRCCCLRFIDNMHSQGCHSYSDITAELIRKFNQVDVHQTYASKNAYNSRIRKFLQFLERESRLSSEHLDGVLMAGSMSQRKEIIVLSEEEIEKIEDYCRQACTPTELRNSAFLQIGLKMGLRGCDIVKLKTSDIDWKNRTISFVQDKTDRQIDMPMPVCVGNAIFKYMRDARPRNISSELVFLSLCAPYHPVGSGAAYKALHTALPDREIPRSGFHVLRKTFATALLNRGSNPTEIADMLGHADMANVHKYLSLDEKRMQLCSLSPSDFGIPLEADYG